MKNNKGFSLIEVMAALFIMMIAATTAVPLLIHVYTERTSIQQEREVLEMLHNRTQKWLMNKGSEPIEDTVTKDSRSYHFFVKDTNSKETLELCVSWTGSNERGYEKCEQVQKSETAVLP